MSGCEVFQGGSQNPPEELSKSATKLEKLR